MTDSEFHHGQRVRDTRDGRTGVVHLFPDAEPGTVTGEVRWNGMFATELELVAEHLIAV